MNQPLDNPNETGGFIPLLQKLIPIALVAVLALYLLGGFYRASNSTELTRFDFDTLAKVPVSEDGRVKPFDTVARNALLMVSGKHALVGDMLLDSEGGKKQPAVIWLAELISGRPEAMTRKVIRIDDPDVLGLIGKTPEDGKYYALGAFMTPPAEGKEPVYFEVGRKAQAASEVRDDERDRFQEHVIGLARKLSTLGTLRARATPFVIPPIEEGQDWAPILESPRDNTLSQAARERPIARDWLDLLIALRDDKPDAFNASVKSYLGKVGELEPGPTKKAAFEVGYNRFAPFIQGIVLYLFAGLLGLLALLLRPLISAGWYKSLWRSGMGVLLLVFVVHTAALIVRIWLQGRPPVTNLYSSAIFIGWAVVGGSIILEKITKLGVASLAASSCGVATLIVAHNLSKDGDTMGVMQAVLDSNFWLGTHVITVTLGYSATLLAGFLALCYIVFGMTTPLLDRKAARALAGMVYAVICFALLFSFVGTVLGGIWADQSWGRFWGWDPKENGAILIVLINAIILHARWGHMIKERGLMVLALGGNIVTIWSWFGTNLLGVGLHSYGFMDGAMFWLAIIIANHLMVMSAAMFLPTHLWMSFTRHKSKGTAALSYGKQIALAVVLLAIGLGVLLTFALLTLLGKLPSYYWFSASILLFSAGAGVGLLVDGLKRMVDEPPDAMSPAAA